MSEGVAAGPVCTWIPHSFTPVRRAAVANGGLVANLVVGRDAAAIRFADLTVLPNPRTEPSFIVELSVEDIQALREDGRGR